MEHCNGQLKLYSSVKEIPVDWLWYPYIPFGKVTLLQGDPGGGKSTLMMNIISAVSNGTETPDGKKLRRPMHVIYQCSEDGAADTIKPRLTQAGADCDNVAFLDEELINITLNDEKIRRAIADFNAKLLVIDPFQAYLGETDMFNAGSMRKLLRQLSLWAGAYDCAIVLIGHMNKKTGSKDIYRGLGSIDVVAVARSVIQIESIEGAETRRLRHVKSSLAPRGDDLYFRISQREGLTWLRSAEAENSTGNAGFIEIADAYASKQEQAASLLQSILTKGPARATEIKTACRSADISERTMTIAKRILGVESFRMSGSWYWTLSNETGGRNTR